MSSRMRILSLSALAFAAGLVLANCHKSMALPFNWDPSAEPIRISAQDSPLLVLADLSTSEGSIQGIRIAEVLELNRSDVEQLFVYELKPAGFWDGLKLNPCLPSVCVIPPPPPLPNSLALVIPRVRE